MSDYKRTAAALAGMVSALAEALEDNIQDDLLRDFRTKERAAMRAAFRGFGEDFYPAERTKYDDKPIHGYHNPHEGRVAAADINAPAPAPVPPAYAIPFPPSQGWRVVDSNGRRWTHDEHHHGRFVCAEAGVDGEDVMLAWHELLAAYGPVRLDEWTEAERAEHALYGPPGQRWGNPDQECPYHVCVLGWGHTGPHQDDAGHPVEAMPADGTHVDASITPQQAAETPCTCGNPTRHQPGCLRYNRTAGLETRAEEEAAISAQESRDEYFGIIDTDRGF